MSVTPEERLRMYVEKARLGGEEQAPPQEATAPDTQQSLRIALTGAPLENWVLTALACLALLTFFFPILAMHLPIVGDQGISGYDVLSKISSLTGTLTSNPSAATSSQASTGSPLLPLSLQMAWLIPALVLAAFACALLALIGSVLSRVSLVKNAATFGAISGAAAVLYVTIVNSDIHGWLQRMLAVSAKDLADNPFAGLFQGLSTALVNAVQIRPAGGLFVLTGCLAVSALLAHTRLLSTFGTRFTANSREGYASRVSYAGFAGLLVLLAAIFVIVELVSSFSGRSRRAAWGRQSRAGDAGDYDCPA